MLGLVNIENKINLTFYNSVNSWRRVLNNGTAKRGVKKLICKVVTSIVIVVTHTNKETFLKLRTRYSFNSA